MQEIAGIDPEMVENIRDSVTAYYSQFEETAPAAAAQDLADADIQPEAEPSAEVAETEASPDRTEERAAEDPVEHTEPGGEDHAGSGVETAAAEPAEPRDIEIAGESDTIIDSGRVSHDESEDSGSQHN